MAELKGIVLSLSQRHTSPRDLLIEADRIISRHLDSRSFITVTYLVVDLQRSAYARVAALNRQFDDLSLGFVDAAIAALAETLGLSRVATTDRRHFPPLAAALSLEILP